MILDGAADIPIGVFSGKTPLEIAKKPNLNYFAENGKLGYMYSIDEKVVPGSDNALISIFGNNPNKCKRGVYEAIGAGFKLKKGDLAIRANLGTIDNLKNRLIIDRRAGRTITTKQSKTLADVLNKKIKLPCKFEFKETVQHRGVLILKGDFSDNISDVDIGLNDFNKEKKFSFSKPLDDTKNSKYTSSLINSFIDQAFKILNNHPVNLERVRKGLLPANMVFLRGSGSEIPKLKKYNKWISINSMPLEIGISKASGMKVFKYKIPKMRSFDVYSHLYKTLNININFAIKTIKRNYNACFGCYIHFKETDIPGHDNKPYEKKNILETIDRNFFSFLKKFVIDYPLKIVVTCDHATPCHLKAHSADPVPVLVYGEDKDNTTNFSEKQSRAGKLGRIYGKDFMKVTGLNK